MRSGSDDTRPDCQASKPGDIGNTQLALDVSVLVSNGFRTETDPPAMSLTDLLSASRLSISNFRVVNPRTHFTLGRWFACHQKGHHVLSEVHLTGSNFVSRSDDHQRGATAGDIIGRHNSMDRLGCGAGRRRTCLIA